MAGPGGGGFGGGGGRGFGGGGGGFGGGPRPPHHHHHHYYGGWGFFGRPRYYGGYYGGGCLGGIFGLILAPIIAIMMAAFFLIFSITGMVSDISKGGSYRWDERSLQSYAGQQYDAIYTDDATYEDNILIVFVADPEDDYTYAYIGWSGDNISTSVNRLFGNRYTALGEAFESSLPEMFENSLSRDLKNVVGEMQKQVRSAGDAFTDPVQGEPIAPKFINSSSFNITDKTVQGALDDFYDNTGISMSLVVADVSVVFEKGLDPSTIVMLIFGVILLAVAIVLIVRSLKNKRNGNPPSGGASGGRSGNDPRYYNGKNNPYDNMRF